MSNLSLKRVVLGSGFLIVIALIFAYLTRDYGFVLNPFKGSNNSQPQIAPNGTPIGLSGTAFSTGTQTGNAANLLEEWLTAINEKGGSGASEIIRAITQSLHDYPAGNEAFYQRVRQILLDPSIDPGRKNELITAMDRAASPAAFQRLVDMVQLNLPADLKRAIVNAIGNAGDYYWDKSSSSQVVPILEQLWLHSEDADVLNSVAAAFVKIGDLPAIHHLIGVIASSNQPLTDAERSKDPRISAAWNGLQGLSDPAAIPLIKEGLLSSSNIAESSIYATMLARMGAIEATQVLLTWARGVGDKYATAVHDAFAAGHTYETIQYINSAIIQNPSFKSNQVKNAILSTLKI
jgi:hypothetical protein